MINSIILSKQEIEVRYSNYFIQIDYLENERNSIARISNAIYFNFLELLKCFIQTQG